MRAARSTRASAAEAPRGGAGIEITCCHLNDLLTEAPRGGAGIEIRCPRSRDSRHPEAPRGGAGIEISHSREIT